MSSKSRVEIQTVGQKKGAKSQIIWWSLNIVEQRLSAERTPSITFIWWQSHLPAMHVILHAPSPENYPPVPVLLTKGRARTPSKHEHSRLGVGRCAEFVSDLSWKIMEAWFWCEAGVCFRGPDPLRCDALHPMWKPLLPLMRFPIMHVWKTRLLLTEVWQKHSAAVWLRSMKRKRNDPHRNITSRGKACTYIFVWNWASAAATTFLIDTLLIVAHSFKITIFHSCSMLYWWQIYGN